MEELSIKLNDEVDISNSMVVLGFPTVGLVGSIAGNFIANSLDLDYIGSISSKFFIPSVVIRNSKPMPPLRIYHAGSDSDICKKNDICDNLVTIVSDFPIPNRSVYPLIDNLFTWFDKKNISLFLGLEGMKSIEKKEDQVDVYGIGSNTKMVEILKDHDLEIIKDGMITGFTGALLERIAEKNENMICMLTEAHSTYPDSRAAGRLLEKVDDMLPSVEMDLEPLYEEAEKLEKKIKKYLEQSKQTSQSQKTNIPQMYR